MIFTAEQVFRGWLFWAILLLTVGCAAAKWRVAAPAFARRHPIPPITLSFPNHLPAYNLSDLNFTLLYPKDSLFPSNFASPHFINRTNNCFDISTPNGRHWANPFVVSVCPEGDSPNACFGVVQIKRRISCEAGCIQVSRVVASDQFLKASFGPDSLLIRFDGPEVVVVHPIHEGNCVHAASFHLRTPGNYSLKVQWLFERYNSVTEMMDPMVWPQHIPFFRHRVVGEFAHLSCERPDQVVPDSALPLCVNGTAPGRWVFNRSAHGSYRWAPFDCEYPTMGWTSPKQYASCLGNTVVTFVGDSQLRSVFYDFLNKLSNKVHFSNDKVMERMIQMYESVVVQYIADPYLRQPGRWYRVQNYSNASASALIVGMGQWPANSRTPNAGHWPDAVYRQFILEKVAEIRSFQQRNPQTVVLWLGMPCFPHPVKVEWSVDSRRSRDRLLHMDNFALDTMRNAGIATVRWFEMSETMMHTSADGAHYTNFVRAAVGNVLVHEICRRWGKITTNLKSPTKSVAAKKSPSQKAALVALLRGTPKWKINSQLPVGRLVGRKVLMLQICPKQKLRSLKRPDFEANEK